MPLKEYQLGDRTFLFDDGDVPEGAELVGDVERSRTPGSFEKLVVQANPLIKREKAEAAEAARVAGLEAEVERLTAELAAATTASAETPETPETPAAEPKTAEKPANKAAPAPSDK